MPSPPSPHHLPVWQKHNFCHFRALSLLGVELLQSSAGWNWQAECTAILFPVAPWHACSVRHACSVWPWTAHPARCYRSPSPFRTASFLCSSNVPSLNYSGLGHWLGPWQMPTCFPGQGCNLDDPSQCGGPALPSPIALNALVGSGMPRTQAGSFPPVPILPHIAAQTVGTL